MKHFVDISRLKTGVEVNVSNDGTFQIGDHIVIQTKIDGANSSVRWEDGNIKCFSRKQELNPTNTLRGFWNYVQKLPIEAFEIYPNYIFFGEWLVSHSIRYNDECYNQWYVYDIYDTVNKRYLTQAHVKVWCEKFGMNYVETLYDGEFTSWDNVKKYLHSSKVYGEIQEGIVIKHQEKLSKDEVEDGHNPSYIKIVNTEFAETKAHNHTQKVADPQKIQAQTHAMEVMATIVTENRVRKEINKMIDEGLLPSILTERDMGIIAKNLPKRIMDDCLKEEKDIVLEAGEFAGKASNRYVMEFARKVVLG
jgi:ATP-dependent RNA circularization protein (DNA/RNA ligase family)